MPRKHTLALTTLMSAFALLLAYTAHAAGADVSDATIIDTVLRGEMTALLAALPVLGIWLYRQRHQLAELDTVAEWSVILVPALGVSLAVLAMDTSRWREAAIAGVIKAAIGLGWNGSALLPLREADSDDDGDGDDDGDTDPPASPPRPVVVALMMLTLGAGAATTQAGCNPQQLAMAASVLGKITQGVGLTEAAVDFAAQKAAEYQLRHPNEERSAEITHALHVARDALKTLRHLSDGTEGATAEDFARAQRAAVDAWETLLDVLSSLGILDAIPPLGGAENDAAPIPKPFELPPVPVVQSWLEGDV